LKFRPIKFNTLKNTSERAIVRVIIATGISSVVTQLFTIREFLTQFRGNEIVIALILFNWLILGGIGTLLAYQTTKRFWRATAARLGFISYGLVLLSPIQLLIIRELRDVFFIHGVSVGFYPTLAYTVLTITPYCLLVGFALPYSLFALRAEQADFPGSRVYITDNIGDVTGGALFSFVLVFLVSPMQALFLANLPLLATTYFLLPAKLRLHPGILAATAITLIVIVSGPLIETATLAPSEGKLVLYRESRYGRITVHQDQDQFTLFEDGVPIFSSQNIILAEEAIHYPLSQVADPRHVLVISAQGGMMSELKKYSLNTVDYVELDPEVTHVQFQFGLLQRIPGLQVIHKDGRAYLAETDASYDAIIINLSEPETFQTNRFFTHNFFRLAKRHLSAKGVLSFSMEGFDNYLAEPQRQKLSSLYNTVLDYFQHVTLLPGQKIVFLCSDRPINTNIPDTLLKNDISTRYISRYFYGNLTNERITRLNELMDPQTPKNTDTAPHLMRLMFSQWFAKYATSPVSFILVLVALTAMYMVRITREEFVLFSTGCMTMGCEILVIFAFQIFFGYIYLQIGIIITIFLAGLLPGAWIGNRFHLKNKRILAFTDLLLIILLTVLILALVKGGDRLPVAFFLVFGFIVSLACGFQFPVALHLGGGDNTAATRAFSADLIGAACGTLFTSLILIPYLGILWATAGLIALKIASFLVIRSAS
jgi:spermidine synthase